MSGGWLDTKLGTLDVGRFGYRRAKRCPVRFDPCAANLQSLRTEPLNYEGSGDFGRAWSTQMRIMSRKSWKKSPPSSRAFAAKALENGSLSGKPSSICWNRCEP